MVSNVALYPLRREADKAAKPSYRGMSTNLLLLAVGIHLPDERLYYSSRRPEPPCRSQPPPRKRQGWCSAGEVVVGHW